MAAYHLARMFFWSHGLWYGFLAMISTGGFDFTYSYDQLCDSSGRVGF
jgi:hypothetical protein